MAASRAKVDTRIGISRKVLDDINSSHRDILRFGGCKLEGLVVGPARATNSNFSGFVGKIAPKPLPTQPEAAIIWPREAVRMRAETKIARLARRYAGQAARAYDKDRQTQAKWLAEQEVVKELLASLAGVEAVLDIPIGTGRFLRIYDEFGWSVTGMDASEDMLAETSRRARSQVQAVRLSRADIRNITAKDRQFDVSVCIRLLNHLGHRMFEDALTELSRVTGGHIVCGIRTLAPASDLLRKGQVFQWPAQIALRLYPFVGRLALTMYEPGFVLRTFAGHGLTIIRSIDVIPRRNGIDYRIYLLAAPGPANPYNPSVGKATAAP
jgi:ubiquinone/menaquinone biosynthesis C-methylase UbiE